MREGAVCLCMGVGGEIFGREREREDVAIGGAIAGHEIGCFAAASAKFEDTLGVFGADGEDPGFEIGDSPFDTDVGEKKGFAGVARA